MASGITIMPMFVVLLMVVVGFVIAVAAKRGPMAGLLAVLGVIGAVLALAVPFFFVGYRSVQVRSATLDSDQSPDVVAGATWVDQLAKEGATVSPHTSMQSAGRALAQSVADAVTKVGGQHGSVVLSAAGDVNPELAEMVNGKLGGRVAARASIEHAENIEKAEATTTSPDVASTSTVGVKPQVASVALKWESLHTTRATWWPDPLTSGTLRADVAGPGGTAVVTAELAEKPWLRSYHSAYAMSASTRPESTEDAARREARQAAVRRLEPVVQARIMELGGKRVTDDVLDRHIQAAVNAKRGVVDETLVRVERPYGPVYYAAQLYNVRPEAIDPIAHGAINETRSRQRSWAGMTMALGGMLAVLGVLYVGLNALTRGYFRAHLGAAAAVLLAVGVVVLVLLVG